MGSGLIDADNVVRSRYECKYLVPPALVGEIRAFIGPFMVPDPHACRSPEHRYPICSLYFDTLDLELYRQTTAGEKNRFKLRVRSYSDEPAAPVFLEVKRRVNDVVLKRRARLPREAAVAVLADGASGWPEWDSGDLLADLDFFNGHLTVAAARPFMKVRYLREAYEATGGDPLRVTFDTDIEWLPTSAVDFRSGVRGWIPTPVPGTVLEIKFTDRYPAWVGELIRAFGLHRQSVAKYVLSVDSLFAASGRSMVDTKRASGPPTGWDGRPDWAREV